LRTCLFCVSQAAKLGCSMMAAAATHVHDTPHKVDMLAVVTTAVLLFAAQRVAISC
jgi:hypothetical protein